MSINIVPWLYH